MNEVEQYGRRNKIVISGIPDDVADDELEDAVTFIMKDVDVIFKMVILKHFTGLGNLIKKLSAKKPWLDLSIKNSVRKH